MYICNFLKNDIYMDFFSPSILSLYPSLFLYLFFYVRISFIFNHFYLLVSFCSVYLSSSVCIFYLFLCNCALFINGSRIDQVYKAKFLEVIIDCNLKWTDHIKHVKQKISKGIGIIIKVWKYFNCETLEFI